MPKLPEQDILGDLKAKKEMMNYAQQALGHNPPAETPKASPVTENVDKINRKAKYGDRPGEKRIPIDQMTKPLGSFKNGTDYVPKTGNYKLHEGEKVVPKEKNMADVFAHVPGRAPEKSPKKEIKHIITSKTHDGKFMHKHVHHNSAHEDETHISSDMADLHNHFEDHAGTPNDGEAAPAGGAPAQLTASPSPMPAASMGA